MSVDISSPSAQAERPLLIVGVSARAAAMSASRAQIPFFALDLFADQDLSELPRALGAARVPTLASLATAHRQFSFGPWMYTGGLENYPALVGKISRQHKLWGNAPSVLRQVRDPRRWHQVLSDAGIPCPEYHTGGTVPAAGQWLCKPYRACGGRQVRLARAGEVIAAPDSFLQEQILGPSGSGIFLASHDRCWLVGVTQQFLRGDLKPTTRHPFQYVGSVVGPADNPGPLNTRWQRIGTTLWRECKLVGLFGVDAIIRVTADGGAEVVPIEINPRYTAAIEVLERALAFPAVAAHCAACRGEDTTPFEQNRTAAAKWYGKSILHASHNVVIDDRFLSLVDQYNSTSPEDPAIADIPRVGTVIRKGQPVVTVLASADTRTGLLQTLGWQGCDGLLQQLSSQ